MKTPTAILAEDEKVLREELRAKLAKLWPELRIVGEAADGVEALRLLAEHAPDVMFLDVEMPRLTGLDVARQAQGRCHVVFVTAYDAHAVAAFEQGAVDYVLKPIDPERFAHHFASASSSANSAPLREASSSDRPHAEAQSSQSRAGAVPIIEVSGRTYPVETRYRPFALDEADVVTRVLERACEV